MVIFVCMLSDNWRMHPYGSIYVPDFYVHFWHGFVDKDLVIFKWLTICVVQSLSLYLTLSLLEVNPPPVLGLFFEEKSDFEINAKKYL